VTTAATVTRTRFVLLRALVTGPLLEHPARSMLALVAIALGVALGVAVHLINASAVNEFEIAARQLAGEANLVVRGARAGFDESLYPKLARLSQVAAANPMLELDASLAGRKDSLKILGLDPLRAVQVQPSLLPEPGSSDRDLFDEDAVMLSPAAAEWLNLKAGDTLRLKVGTQSVAFRIAGLLPHGAYRQRVAVMDIAAAQWRLARLGQLNRVDLKLKPGTDIEGFQREVVAMLPAGVHAETPQSESAVNASLSRAYRLNLDMLALVALFTGAFLVFSSQVLALLRRRSQLALLRVLGLTRAGLAWRLIVEGVLIGIVGSALGVALGWVLANATLRFTGADLGAGYFRGLSATLRVDWSALAALFMLGVAFAAAGAAIPAWEAARRAPALALKAGDEEDALRPLRSSSTSGWAFALIALGVLLTILPPVNGLPLPGYAAIAATLLGSVLLMPQLAAAVLACLPLPRAVPTALAFAQLKATPRQAAISIAAIVISMSLMSSMMIMVSSFRESLNAWLTQVLPADLYLRAARTGDTGYLTLEEQARIAAAPGIARTEFQRTQSLLVRPGLPPLTLLARAVDAKDTKAPGEGMPLIGSARLPKDNEPPPVWVSEVAADLHGWRTGDRVNLPIGGAIHAYTVAGIWRDYSRQNGAIVINRALYIELTGDRAVTDAAIWLSPGTQLDDGARALRKQLAHTTVEIASLRELREASLAIFDRTFAVTYALEIAAIVIGLFGVSVSFSAQVLSRRREFGVLRHIGVTRREVGVMLGTEGAATALLGAIAGLVLGWVIGLILIHVVNRQSFHWSMDLHMPWLQLATLTAVIVVSALATAIWSARAAMSDTVVKAVREDW
jgi:putative ABC transport system permease protein